MTSPALDLTKAEFWDLGKVDGELRRVYDICGGCRRCLPLCPSFKVMFDRMDVEAVDGDVEKLPAADVKEVVDLCYQCKLCFNHCPYTPPHRWAVDFPRLMLRARAAEARRGGVTLQDRMLGNTDLVGQARQPHGAALQLDERAGRAPGVHAVDHRHPPQAAPAPLPSADVLDVVPAARPAIAAGTSRSVAPSGTAASTVTRKVALFATCSVEYNAPAIGRAAVARARAQRRRRRAARASAAAGCPTSTAARRPVPGARARQRAHAGRRGARGAGDRLARARRAATCSSRSTRGSTAPRTPSWWPRTRATSSSTWRGLHAAGALDTRFERPIGRGHLPRALSSARAEHRHQVRRRAARDARRRGHGGRALLGGRRDLGLQDGVLRSLAEGGQAAVRRGAGRADGRSSPPTARWPPCRSPRAPGPKPAIPSRSWPHAYGLEDA